ncbi:hypothetical protein Q0F99_09230 [Rathayibacter oskolensis]|uniref:hypothetical protein n=1 Tax=Rathayibacter TaxID=33886 RepID=UPI00131639EA|nr:MULTISPECIES: hypothetical protein [Rathayibacter]QHC65319.1 hypothetical protein GSU68_01170 [Rathayibacter sp. VKM Ac-2759]WKK73014.1 hypothetical protein Q0F99_09230 [Rathayibacter oskolensis]
MQKIYYASGFVLVGDAICTAVLEYARALADVGKSDLVSVPSMSDEGLRGEVRLLLGPASQIFAAPALDRGVDLEDDAAVASMRDKTARLQLSRPQAGDQDQPGSALDFDAGY